MVQQQPDDAPQTASASNGTSLSNPSDSSDLISPEANQIANSSMPEASEWDDEDVDADVDFDAEGYGGNSGGTPTSGAATYEHHHFTCDRNQGLVRIDKFVVDHVAHASRTKVQAAAEAGNILVNGKPVKANYRVKPADEISIVMSYPPCEVEIVPQNIPLNIVYEDDALLVVNKPAGMCVHPGFGNYDGTLVNALAWHLRGLPMFSDVKDPRPGLVHRIDKDTSGLLVIAKTEQAKMNLAHQFFVKSTERTYVALVWGSMEQDHGTIRGNIGRSVRDRKVMDVFPEDSNVGKHAVTHYDVLERLGYVTLVQCHLETGRTHQIRAHFRHIGHPLFGDQHYGGDQILRGTTFPKYRQFVTNCLQLLPRQALHAKTLGFLHPVTNERMLFDSPIAEDLQTCIDKWRNYISNR